LGFRLALVAASMVTVARRCALWPELRLLGDARLSRRGAAARKTVSALRLMPRKPARVFAAVGVADVLSTGPGRAGVRRPLASSYLHVNCYDAVVVAMAPAGQPGPVRQGGRQAWPT